MIYMWFTGGINRYYKLAVEKDRDSYYGHYDNKETRLYEVNSQ